MDKRYLLAAYRLFFSALTASAIFTQFRYGLVRPEFNIANFFSFFTIESNILATAVFFFSGITLLAGYRQHKWVYILRGAATLYMITTGIVYVLLLSGLEESLQTPIPWVNNVLHFVMPLAVLADWLIDRPKEEMRFKKALIWLTFPVAYWMYSMIRGIFTDWYPYPFLNPAVQGYVRAVESSILIAGALVGLTWLIVRVSQLKDLFPKRT